MEKTAENRKRTRANVGGPSTSRKWQSTVELRKFKSRARNAQHFENINEYNSLKARLQELEGSLKAIQTAPKGARPNIKFYLSPAESALRYDITKTKSRISYLASILPPEILTQLESTKSKKQSKTG